MTTKNLGVALVIAFVGVVYAFAVTLMVEGARNTAEMEAACTVKCYEHGLRYDYHEGSMRSSPVCYCKPLVPVSFPLEHP